MKKIKFNDLRLQNIKYEKEFKKTFERLLNKGIFILGPEVKSFEKEFAKYIGVKFGIGVASGTDALILALLSLNLKSEDEIAIPVNVYPVAFAVASAGFNVKLIDIDPTTFNLDVKDLEKKVTKNTKAVILVHLFGKAAEIKNVLDFAKRKKILVIEDCSQAHGTLYKGRRVGSFGQVSCFSFYPTKNLGALGDGGMVLTDNKVIADKIRALRQYGEVEKYESKFLGRISRLDEAQAAFLRVKLKKLNNLIKNRTKKANLYIRELKDIDEITLPINYAEFEHTYHLFVIKAKKRNALKKYLEEKGIETMIHYPHLINEVFTFSYLKYKNEDFPNAVISNNEILSLPLYPDISNNDIKYVCSVIKKFYRK